MVKNIIKYAFSIRLGLLTILLVYLLLTDSNANLHGAWLSATLTDPQASSMADSAAKDAQFTINSLTSGNIPLITQVGTQSRPLTAIDAANINRMAVVANDLTANAMILRTTQDGGVSWSETLLPATLNGKKFFTAQNGALAYDTTGRLLIAYTLANLTDYANALVITSTFDGINFEPLTAISDHPASEQVIDSHPTLAIAASNNVYVVWDSFATSTHNFSIKLAKSVVYGVFSTPMVLSEGMIGSPAIAISRHENIYVGWNDWGFNGNAPFYNSGGRLMIALSKNRGSSFNTPSQIGLTNIGFARRINAMPDAGASPNLTLIADTRTEGMIYATYTIMGKGLDVVFTSSVNYGATWKTGKVVNNDTGNADQFNPTMVINSSDGSIKIAFYDTRLNADNNAADVFLANAPIRSLIFTNTRVTSVASNDSKTNPYRDYTANLGERISISSYGNVVILGWTDTRQGNEDIFISILNSH